MKHVLFIHGFCEHAGMWQEVVSTLPSKDYQFHSIDLPGFGTNNKSVDSISQMAAFVINYMDHHEVLSATVIGHSMGGYVALEVLENYPNRLDGVGLIHSHAAADGEVKKLNRQKLIDFVSKHGPGSVLKEFAKSLLPPTVDNADLQQKAYDLVKNTSTEAIVAASKAMIHRKSHLNTIQQTNLPLLWVIGKLDGFITFEEVVRQAASCNQAQLEILENTGHLCMYETPQKTVEVIQKYLSWVSSLTQ